MNKGPNTGKSLLIFAVVLGVILVIASFFVGGRTDEDRPTPPPTPNDKPTDSPHVENGISFPERDLLPDTKPYPRIPQTSGTKWQNLLRGRVIQENGDGVPNATVTVEEGMASLFTKFLEDPPRFHRSTQTDNNGYYRFEQLPPHENYIVSVSHPRFAPTSYSYVHVFRDKTTEVADLILTPGFTLRVSVRERQGNSIPNADLSVEHVLRNPFSQPTSPKDQNRGKTDSAGNFEFHNLQEGQWSLTVRAKGFGSRTVPNILCRGEQKTVLQSVTLGQGEIIAGKVTDSTGRPIPNAKIEARSYSSHRPSKGSGSSNDFGEFRIDDLSKGTYVLVVTAKNYTTKRENRIGAGSKEVMIILTSQGTAKGRVLGKKTGRPIHHFSIEVRRPLPNGTFALLGREIQQFSSPNGSFLATGLDQDNQYILLIKASNFAPAFSEPFTITGPEPVTGLEIALTPGGSVQGTLIDARTRLPIAEATIQTHEDSFADNPFSSVLSSVLPQDSLQVSARTRADGSFFLKNIRPGAYQIEIMANGYAKKFVKDLQILESQNLDIGEILLTTGASVIGTIYDSQGKPFPGGQATIRSLSPQSMLIRHTRADSQGIFMIKNLPPGNYQISVSSGSPEAGNLFKAIQEGAKNRQTLTLKEGDEVQLIFTIG